jgi:hypothetical protein
MLWVSERLVTVPVMVWLSPAWTGAPGSWLTFSQVGGRQRGQRAPAVGDLGVVRALGGGEDLRREVERPVVGDLDREVDADGLAAGQRVPDRLRVGRAADLNGQQLQGVLGVVIGERRDAVERDVGLRRVALVGQRDVRGDVLRDLAVVVVGQAQGVGQRVVAGLVERQRPAVGALEGDRDLQRSAAADRLVGLAAADRRVGARGVEVDRERLGRAEAGVVQRDRDRRGRVAGGDRQRAGGRVVVGPGVRGAVGGRVVDGDRCGLRRAQDHRGDERRVVAGGLVGALVLDRDRRRAAVDVVGVGDRGVGGAGRADRAGGAAVALRDAVAGVAAVAADARAAGGDGPGGEGRTAGDRRARGDRRVLGAAAVAAGAPVAVGDRRRAARAAAAAAARQRAASGERRPGDGHRAVVVDRAATGVAAAAARAAGERGRARAVRPAAVAATRGAAEGAGPAVAAGGA